MPYWATCCLKTRCLPESSSSVPVKDNRWVEMGKKRENSKQWDMEVTDGGLPALQPWLYSVRKRMLGKLHWRGKDWGWIGKGSLRWLTRQQLWDTQHRRKSVKSMLENWTTDQEKLTLESKWEWDSPVLLHTKRDSQNEDLLWGAFLKGRKRNLCLIQQSRQYKWKKPTEHEHAAKVMSQDKNLLITALNNACQVYQALVFMKI